MTIGQENREKAVESAATIVGGQFAIKDFNTLEEALEWLNS